MKSIRLFLYSFYFKFCCSCLFWPFDEYKRTAKCDDREYTTVITMWKRVFYLLLLSCKEI